MATLVGPGAKAGTVPTDIEQSTGMERLELLGNMKGIKVFDMEPIKVDRIATVDNPIIVNSFDDHAYVGCTGLNDSHDAIWYTVEQNKLSRCIEWYVDNIFIMCTFFFFIYKSGYCAEPTILSYLLLTGK